MTLKKMMLDGYAGFGGQSQAFLDAGWDVLRIDNNPLLANVERMAIMDLRAAKPFNISQAGIEYAHFSPPCHQFSLAFNAPRAIAIREGFEIEYDERIDMTDVENAKRLIDALKPRYWSVENVRGAIKYIEPILGPPRLIVGAWVYWGNFPLFDPSTIGIAKKANQDKRHSPLRANYRAHIPYEVSKAFFDAMTKQTSILQF